MIPAAAAASVFGLAFLGVTAAGFVHGLRPRWYRRWNIRRRLREMAHYRRRLRDHIAIVEAAYRAGHPSTDPYGRELAALVVLLVDCDDRIDLYLDQLGDLDREVATVP